ncbi:hypothetical protein GOP47_0010458 [Adiantum capillus-veneris]|uniref:Protein kinase domain-containing protein n=1 Tax=Adiantum capillus-veneris TaxID=13818 RepID=A0A9D4ZHT0_ADICA|nr:hypothetical protein GOP47_0010458 [Adiantum capillus-veneris]
MFQLSIVIAESEAEVFSSLNAIWADASQEDDSLQMINALKHDIAEWENQLSQKDLPTNLQEEVMAQCCMARYLLRKLENERIVGASNDRLLESLWVDPLQFTIKQSIGHGAFATVHEVEWFGQRFAQKEFFDVDECFFGKEAAIQARLRHPNVLQLICCTSNLGSPPLPLLIAVDLMLQIAKGMEYLHGLHIMHRDLKSKKLLVCNQISGDSTQGGRHMRVKVADFGMSKAKYTSSKYTTLHTGTTYWRAPEVFKTLGADWVFAATRGFTTKSMTITIEMSWYNELESKLREQIEAAAKIKQSRLTDLVSKVLGRFRGSPDKGRKQEEYVMIPDSVKQCGFPLRKFSYQELHRATDGFGTNNQIRWGGRFGRVFIGRLPDGQVVAVKDFTDGSVLAFLTELEVSGRISHPNIVPNLGFCYEEGNLLLKYKIVCGLASALCFLQNEFSPLVLDGDVNPNIIFLDDDISKTAGYKAPEYLASGNVGLKADLYSFGVVVLELLLGRRAIHEYAWTLLEQERLFDAARGNIRREAHHYDEEEFSGCFI